MVGRVCKPIASLNSHQPFAGALGLGYQLLFLFRAFRSYDNKYIRLQPGLDGVQALDDGGAHTPSTRRAACATASRCSGVRGHPAMISGVNGFNSQPQSVASRARLSLMLAINAGSVVLPNTPLTAPTRAPPLHWLPVAMRWRNDDEIIEVRRRD